MRFQSELPCFSKLLVLLLTSTNIVTAQSPNLTQLRSDLDALVNTLQWQNGTYKTYQPIYQAATKACTTLKSTVKKDPKSVPQSASYSEVLHRLIHESKYLSDLSAPATYQPGVLDSELFLNGSVAEWQYAISLVRTNLEKPSTLRFPNPGSSTAPGIGPKSKAGTVFSDIGKGPQMVVVPAGAYTAGSTPLEQDTWSVPTNRRDFELPRRQVRISYPLAFGRTEVTVGQFDTFVKETNYQTRGGARWWDPSNPVSLFFNKSLTYLSPGFPQSSTSPVVAVRRQDAEAYAKWLSTITSAKYRLPSEDEWEWAARAGSRHTFFWGDDISLIGSWANSYDNTSRSINNFGWDNTPVFDTFAYTAPVASFGPNAFGLYDMTGNAREFTSDTRVRDLSHASNDGRAHTGPQPFPVLRGGAWNYQQQNLRLNYRSAYFSSEVATNMFGFRVVREL